jgi:WD40 repeat protein
MHIHTTSPQTGFLFSAAGDGIAYCWDLNTQTCVYTLHGHEDYLHCIKVNSLKQQVITGSEDGTCRVWGPVLYFNSFLLSSLFSLSFQFGVVKIDGDKLNMITDIRTKECIKILDPWKGIATAPQEMKSLSSSNESSDWISCLDVDRTGDWLVCLSSTFTFPPSFSHISLFALSIFSLSFLLINVMISQYFSIQRYAEVVISF